MSVMKNLKINLNEEIKTLKCKEKGSDFEVNPEGVTQEKRT